MQIHAGNLSLIASTAQAEANQDKRIAEDRRKRLFALGSYSDAMTNSDGSWAVHIDAERKGQSKDTSSDHGTANASNASVAPVSYWA